jgi:hypothetical protein
LRQCEWNGADGHKQKQVKCASDKMRFDGGINLLFHFGVVLVRILISSVTRLHFGVGHSFCSETRRNIKPFFRNSFEVLTGENKGNKAFLVLTGKEEFLFLLLTRESVRSYLL